jgi:hypothetical protein
VRGRISSTLWTSQPPFPLLAIDALVPVRRVEVATITFFSIKDLGSNSLFGWLVVDGWCWFVLREEYCWLVAGGWFVLREKYCWLVADKPSEQGVRFAGGGSGSGVGFDIGRETGRNRGICRKLRTVSFVFLRTGNNE